MNPMEGLARQAEWVGRNIAYNLGFIPPEKLNWKPAPTAKSALEAANHVAGLVTAMTPVLGGGPFSPPQAPPATSLKEAQDLVTNSAREYAAALRRLTLEDLGKTIELPF